MQAEGLGKRGGQWIWVGKICEDRRWGVGGEEGIEGNRRYKEWEKQAMHMSGGRKL